MKTDNKTDKLYDLPDNLGMDLLSEAAAALFEDPEYIAELLSPEEAEEYEQLRKRAMESCNLSNYQRKDNSALAAEEGKEG